MPYEYRLNIGCVVTVYSEVINDKLTVVLQPHSKVEELSKRVASELRETISDELREFDLTFQVTWDDSPPKVTLTKTCTEDKSLYELGEIIGESIVQVEEEIIESDNIDNNKLLDGVISSVMGGGEAPI